jgi:secondary thiamine-phosphate synthase enzyme
MRQMQKTLSFHTEPYSMQNIAAAVQECVEKSSIAVGVCHVFVRHTSASLVIQENADPDVRTDLMNFMSRTVPENGPYRHVCEGPDDMPSHIRTAITHTSETIPVSDGKLLLGTWQGLYLWEHRATPHTRQVVVHVLGE